MTSDELDELEEAVASLDWYKNHPIYSAHQADLMLTHSKELIKMARMGLPKKRASNQHGGSGNMRCGSCNHPLEEGARLL